MISCLHLAKAYFTLFLDNSLCTLVLVNEKMLNSIKRSYEFTNAGAGSMYT